MMGKAYSDDLGQRIRKGRSTGICRYNRSPCCSRWAPRLFPRRWFDGGWPVKQVAKKLVDHHEALLKRVRLQPDITLSELQEWLRPLASRSIGGLWSTPTKLGLTFKEKRVMLPNRRGLMLGKCAAFGRSVSPPSIRPN